MLIFRRVIVFTSLSLGLASLIGCAPAWADDPPPRFVFADESSVTASPDATDTFKFDFVIKNVGGTPGDGTLTLSRTLGKGCDTKAGFTVSEKSIHLEPNFVKIVHVEISNVALPATCYVQMATTTKAPAQKTPDQSQPQSQTQVQTQAQDKNAAENVPSSSLKQVKLTQNYFTSTVWEALAKCWVISIVAVLVALAIACGWAETFDMSLKLGSPAWEFAKSWTSSVTLVGGVFSAAAAFSALPELTKYASKSGYGILSLLISLAVVFAPFVFFAVRKGEIEPDKQTQKYAVVYQGYLPLFLLSCALTLFAGLAQLVVLFLLFRELFPVSDPWSQDYKLIATEGLGLLICIYAVQSIYQTIRLQAKENADAPKRPGLQQDRLKKLFTELGIKDVAGINGLTASAVIAEPMETGVARPLSWPVL